MRECCLLAVEFAEVFEGEVAETSPTLDVESGPGWIWQEEPDSTAPAESRVEVGQADVAEFAVVVVHWEQVDTANKEL